MALSWGARPDTPQVRGRKTEARILKARGAVVHPMSGAGSIKEDGHDDHNLYEVKDTRRSFTLTSKALLTNYRRALRQGRQGVFLVYFSDDDVTAEIRLVPGGRALLGDTES